MRRLRIITFICFLLAAALLTASTVYQRMTRDDTLPVVECPREPLTLSVRDGEEALLEGVTAYDEKDGDISDKVLVESVSKFIKPGTFIVTYAVSDSDCHVSKAKRTVHYKDYTPPEFYMKRALVYSVDEEVNIRDAIGARDCIDGDISDRVTITATDYVVNTQGVFTVSVQVANSMGDMIDLDVTVHVEGNETMAPEIQLEKSLIYIKKGEKPVFEDYLKEVTVNGVLMENYGLLISTNFDSEKEGTYNVHYYVSTAEGYEGHSILTVVVE